MTDSDRSGMAGLPRSAATGQALSRTAHPGYYPGFSTLSQQDSWDQATRDVVLARVKAPPEIEFFDQAAALFWTVVFDHLLPQSDRTVDARVLIVNVVDQRLKRNETGGYRFADMPPDREAYRLGREAIDAEAQAAFGAGFLEGTFEQQDRVLKAIHDAEPKAAASIWKNMSIHRFWQLIMGDAADAYYAHPFAWDEIGFGGPAYPRAYTRLERGEPEPWEVHERRYDWIAPPGAASAETENVQEYHLESEQHRSHSKASGES